MRMGAAGKWFGVGIVGATISCASLCTLFCTAANAQQLDQKVGQQFDQKVGQQFDQKLYSEMRWRRIGPFRGGRAVAVSGVPHQPNVFYMAAVNGGVWKTTDFGNTWNPIFDDQPTGSVGALAVAPSDPNIIYVGSGEGLQRPDLATGDGIYKSTDAGKTWTHLGSEKGGSEKGGSDKVGLRPTAFSSPPKGIPTVPTPSAASSARPMAERASRKFSTKMKTPAPPISLSIPRIRRRFTRRCGPRALRRGRCGAALPLISQGAGCINQRMAVIPGSL